VPRAGRDGDYQPIAEAASKSADWKCPICAGVFPASTTIHPCKPAAEGLPKSPPPRSAQPTAPTEKHRISTQIAPRSEADPGTVIEGYYTVSGGMLYVEDAQGRALGAKSSRPVMIRLPPLARFCAAGATTASMGRFRIRSGPSTKKKAPVACR